MRYPVLLISVAACSHEPSLPAAPPGTDHAGAAAVADLRGRGAWFVDEENDAVLLASPSRATREFPCAWPTQVVASNTGAVFAACRGEGAVRRLTNPTAEWRVGPEPRSLALDEAAHRLYVGLATSNEVVMLDSGDGRVLARVKVAAEPTALALYEGGLAVGSRKSQVIEVHPRGLDAGPRHLWLQAQLPSSPRQSLGVEHLVPARGNLVAVAAVAALGAPEQPSYYSGVFGTPVVQQLFVLRLGSEPVLHPQQTVSLPEVVSAVFVDQPWTGGVLMLAGRGMPEVTAVELAIRPEWRSRELGSALPIWELGAGVAGLTDDGETSFAFVESTRSVYVTESHGDRVAQALEMKGLRELASPRRLEVPASRLDPVLALGRRLFHSANDPRVARGALSCATCHRDGRDDGRTWAGQGTLRQTPMLAGRDLGATAPFGWNGAYPTLEQYIHFTITSRMGGRGLPPDELFALASYVREGLHRVERPEAPRLSLKIAHGRALFESQGCASCHPAEESFTDGDPHDIESLSATERAGWERSRASRGARAPSAYDTPSLLQASLTAPYLHDGSATTLDDVFTRLGDHMGNVEALSPADRASLVAYLSTL